MINGFYKIYLDGNCILESKNIITTSGKTVLKQFLAGNIPSWGGALAIGAMNTAATIDDQKLGFEIDRAAVLTKTVDADGNIALRAAFPLDLEARINEIAVYPFMNTTANGRYQDSVITDFSESGWSSNAHNTTVNSMFGKYNVLLDSTNSTSTLTGLSIDISGYSQIDKFELLVNNLDSYSKTLTLAITDNTGLNTATYQLPNLNASSGLQSISIEIGAPGFDVIGEISITSSNTHKDVSLDALKFLNADESGYATYLVSRSVVPSTIVKLAGQDLEVEYYLAGL